MALLRGANRPLLTRLVEHEVETEVNEYPRSGIDIDFRSHRVIQCEHDELNDLNEDEVVHSIGSGRTERLTSFFQEPIVQEKKKRTPERKNSSEEGEEGAEEESSKEEPVNGEENRVEEGPEGEVNGEADKEEERKEGREEDSAKDEEEAGGEGEDEKEVGAEEAAAAAVAIDDDVEEEEEEEDEEREVVAPNGEINVNEGFGVKKQKKAKKMETGLLKEILDAKPSKRYGH